jgi:hypothetical protein
MLNRGSLSDRTQDETPAEDVLVRFSAGQRKDEENIVFKLVKRLMNLYTLHHRGTVSREGFRIKVLEWLMGPLEADWASEQVFGRRRIDTNRFPPMGYHI